MSTGQDKRFTSEAPTIEQEMRKDGGKKLHVMSKISTFDTQSKHYKNDNAVQFKTVLKQLKY